MTKIILNSEILAIRRNGDVFGKPSFQAVFLKIAVGFVLSKLCPYDLPSAIILSPFWSGDVFVEGLSATVEANLSLPSL